MDNCYKFETNIKHVPWVGDRYRSGGRWRKRVLILGEAHYAGSEADMSPSRDRTIRAVETQWEGDESWSYFTKLAQAFTGKRGLSNDEKSAFWEDVAFYNVIQKVVSIGAGTPPKQEMWDSSLPLLKRVLRVLRPGAVIAVSDRLWTNLDDWKMSEKRGHQYCEIPNCGHTIPATWIPHPRAARFGWGGKWYGVISEIVGVASGDAGRKQ